MATSSFAYKFVLIVLPLTIISIQFVQPAYGESVYLAGFTYEDENADGNFDENERPLRGVFLTIVDEGGKIIDEAVSLDDGSFSFEDISTDELEIAYLTALIPDGYNSTEPSISQVERQANPDYVFYRFANFSAVRQQDLIHLNFGFSSMNPVIQEFTHEESGASIVFPAGWTMDGPVIDGNSTAAGATIVDPTSGSILSTMALKVEPKSLPGQDIAEIYPLDHAPNGIRFSLHDYTCKMIAASPIDIQGIESWQSEWTCIDDNVNDTSLSLKTILMQSSSHVLTFEYASWNNEAYVRHMPDADATIQTLRLHSAQVVPEFPLSIIVLSATMLGILVVFRRTKLFKSL